MGVWRQPQMEYIARLEALSYRIPMQFDHIAKQVPDIGQAVTWYRQHFLESKILYQDETWAFIEVHGLKMAFVKEDQS